MKMKVSRRGRAGGGRGRGGGQGSHQDYPYTPLHTSYATRSSTQVAPVLLPRSPRLNASRNPSLPPALRVLKKDEVGCSSLPKEADIVHENTAEDIKPTSPTEEETELDHSQPSREKSSEAQRHEPTLSSRRFTSQNQSINLTEYARGLVENSKGDPEEVNSDPNHVIVHGHRVKRENADLVGAIFKKYGDITTKSEVRSPRYISFFETVCDVYQKLQKSKLLDLTSAEIKGMIGDIQIFQKEKLEIGWLLRKLHVVYETTNNVLVYSEIKKAAEKCAEFDKNINKELEQCQMHIASMQKKMSNIQKQKIANQVKAMDYAKMALEIKAKVIAFANQSLVQDLL